MIRSEESYIKQSYRTYKSKLWVAKYLGKGVREAMTYEEYAEAYRARKRFGESTSKMSQEYAAAGIVFTAKEAQNIARELVQRGTADDIQALGLSVESYTKSGSISINALASQIQTFSPMRAHQFVADAIDMGIYGDGDNFEEYTY